MSHAYFDFADLSPKERYKLLIGSVIPRPIALVTTIGRDGRHNAGPFSFFNVLTHDPAVVALGIENYADGRFKDTARNIRETEEFTVHICDRALVDQMEVCAIKFGPEVDELAEAGLETVQGTHVACPRIVAAPAALECRRLMGLEVGPAREIVLGRVEAAFIRETLVDPATHHIDQMGMDAVGRLGGHLYACQREQFEIMTQTPEDWFKSVATDVSTR
jgi:flavin reductase (DIM6/NTAB) family NADH-FMN oxidoreductase RutF